LVSRYCKLSSKLLVSQHTLAAALLLLACTACLLPTSKALMPLLLLL
jgi:hypothetical protein